ncbi:MAG: hypothetical protein P8M18_07355 [Woeseiaceae bacterium]|nr:hypothetical protein [Woeseiaceae bacterium]
MSGRPRIIYIPGLKPKPELPHHRTQLLRCLVEGVRRINPRIADAIAEPEAFHVVSWTYDFYDEHRDIALDIADIDSLLAREQASEQDIENAASLKRRFIIRLFRIANYLPFIVPGLATDEIEVHRRDYFCYVRNNLGIAQAARDKLKSALVDAASSGRRVLLLAHSMGSVIAWDALWQMTRDGVEAPVDQFLTIGSPLGQKIVQRNLLGRQESVERRYPDGINRWINIAAIGELTAIDRHLRNDFSGMSRQGRVCSIEDRECFNWYHMHGALNVHAEYGYLVNEVTAQSVVDWWLGVSLAGG